MWRHQSSTSRRLHGRDGSACSPTLGGRVATQASLVWRLVTLPLGRRMATCYPGLDAPHLLRP